MGSLFPVSVRWVPSQRRTTKPRRLAEVDCERDFLATTSEIPPRGEDSRQGPQKFSTAGSPGSGIVPRRSYRERIFARRVAGSRSLEFPSFQRSWGPFTEKDDEAQASEPPRFPPLGSGSPPPLQSRIFAGSGSVSQRDSPAAGVPGSGIPRQGHRERDFGGKRS